jgi:hypothetical protein
MDTILWLGYSSRQGAGADLVRLAESMRDLLGRSAQTGPFGPG